MHTFANAEPPKVSFHYQIIDTAKHVLRSTLGSQAALKLKYLDWRSKGWTVRGRAVTLH